MECKCVNILDELRIVQTKISSMFKDIFDEKNKHKVQLERLKISLKKQHVTLEKLKKENNMLKGSNDKLKVLICKCASFFKDVSFSNVQLNKKQKNILDELQKLLVNASSNQQDNFILTEVNKVFETKINSSETEKNNTDLCERSQYKEEIFIDEIQDMKDLNFSKQIFHEDKDLLSKSMKDLSTEVNQSFILLPSKHTKSLTSHYSKNEENVPEIMKSIEEKFPKEPGVETTPNKKELILNVNQKSPVFKDLGNAKLNDYSSEEGNCNDVSRDAPLKMLNEQFLFAKPREILSSPVKRTADSMSIKGESPKSKRIKNKSMSNSPQRFQIYWCKKSHSKAAEISSSGVRKLTQTLLNVECFKKRKSDKIKESEVENVDENVKTLVERAKFLGDGNEDDVIMESPKSSKLMSGDVMKLNKKTVDIIRECQLSTPPPTPDADLDETYISSSIVKNLLKPARPSLDLFNKEPSFSPASNSQQSLKDDSVPFVYQREPVRRKEERMKLPGRMCLECKKYYADIYENDMNDRNLKEILNRCSRHRGKNSPSLEDTPPGYWKPYLTASTIISPDNSDDR